VSASSASNAYLNGPGVNNAALAVVQGSAQAGGELEFEYNGYLAPGYYVLTFTYNVQGNSGDQQATIKFYWAGS
jgi:hypothetical protein